MSRFAERIRPHVSAELELATRAERQGDASLAFSYLERAHVLGQTSTREHVRVHWAMLRWSVRHRNPRELVGQVLRILGAAAGTPVGLVPSGNTGGSKVSAFARLPIPEDLRARIEEARVV
jgi:hypothetical protein